jgi:limonene-1,2-epoxide hydrolase
MSVTPLETVKASIKAMEPLDYDAATILSQWPGR